MKREKLDYTLLVIGLGSMGKRRVRNLQAIGFTNIYGYDQRADRCAETRKMYNISIVDNLEQFIQQQKPSAFIISVPPDVHHIYMQLAIDHNIHFFVEASVVDDGMEEIIRSLKTKSLVAAPSSTLFFHPAIQQISALIAKGELGKITNFVYHCGQYLPDWHTYEKVSEFYVSKKETGGAREIVPFELTWMTKLLGFPKEVAAINRKTINIEGAEEIDDTYNALLHYDGFIVNLIIDVVSRYATRKLLVNGEKKQLVWSWDENVIKVYDPVRETWDRIEYQVSPSATGYNKNITEQMYFDELHNFFDAIENRAPFFNSMEYDHRVLKLLYCLEESFNKKRFQPFIG